MTPDDYAKARRLLASAVVGGTFDDGPVRAAYHHDHDEELRTWDQNAFPHLRSSARSVTGSTSRSAHRRHAAPADDLTYWLETGRLVSEYFRLQADAADSEVLRQGFIGWLRRSPAEHRLYLDGDDMTRAALVDWFLRLAR